MIGIGVGAAVGGVVWALVRDEAFAPAHILKLSESLGSWMLDKARFPSTFNESIMGVLASALLFLLAIRLGAGAQSAQSPEARLTSYLTCYPRMSDRWGRSTTRWL
ncbi:MAG: hypothetical protein ABIS15_08995 [Gemmatimonadaceae bacterium]